MIEPAATHASSPTNNFFSNSLTAIERSYHQFIPTLASVTSQTWDRLKGVFVKESKETLYIRKLLAMDTIVWSENKEKISDILIKGNPYNRQGHLLKSLLKRCDEESMRDILCHSFDKIFETSKTRYETLIEFFDADKVKMPSGCKSLEEELEEMASCLPQVNGESENSVEKEIRNTFNVVIRFFPNFMDTMLKAFNLIEAGKGPETIWDFAAMMEIYFKMFMIPHGIFVIVGALVSVPWQLFLITGGIIIAAVIGICLYLKYRPCPNKLPRATNLTEQGVQGKLDPVVGREKEIQEIGTYIGKKKDGILTDLILVGPTGVGKTELVKGVAQQYREKTIFALSATELASGYTSVGDKLRLLFLDIKGHEDKVVFFIDEFGDAIKKNPQVNIAGYLKPLLGPAGVQVIAAVTSEEYKEQILTDDALQDRFTKIDVKPLSDDQILSILQKRMENKGKAVRFTSNIAEEILTRTKQMSQPRNSVKLLDLAINRVRAFDIDKYVSKEFLDTRNELEKKQKEYQAALDHGLEDKSTIVKQIGRLKEKMMLLQEKDRQKRQLAKKVRELIRSQREMKTRRSRLAVQDSSNPMLPLIQWSLLPWMEDKIKKMIPEADGIPLQVDKGLIQQIKKDWESAAPVPSS